MHRPWDRRASRPDQDQRPWASVSGRGASSPPSSSSSHHHHHFHHHRHNLPPHPFVTGKKLAPSLSSLPSTSLVIDIIVGPETHCSRSGNCEELVLCNWGRTHTHCVLSFKNKPAFTQQSISFHYLQGFRVALKPRAQSPSLTCFAST